MITATSAIGYPVVEVVLIGKFSQKLERSSNFRLITVARFSLSFSPDGDLIFGNSVNEVKGFTDKAREIPNGSILFKTPVRVQRDIPGFVMNRIFFAAFQEAMDLVAKGAASLEDVDIGMRLGYGWKAGPFEIADNTGLDTFNMVGESMKALGEERLISRSDLIARMVREKRLGRKVGKGFYRYTPEGKRLPWGNKEQSDV